MQYIMFIFRVDVFDEFYILTRSMSVWGTKDMGKLGDEEHHMEKEEKGLPYTVVHVRVWCVKERMGENIV